jgi:hypothetical protein
MRPQSCESPSWGNFRTLTWESWDKKPLDVAPVERYIIYYKEEGGGLRFSPGRGEYCESKLPVVHPSTKSVPIID